MFVSRAGIAIVLLSLLMPEGAAFAQPSGQPGCSGASGGRSGCVRLAFTASHAIATALELGIRHALTGTSWTDQARPRVEVPVVVYYPGGNASDSYYYMFTDPTTNTSEGYTLEVYSRLGAAVSSWSSIPFTGRPARHDLANESEGRPVNGVVVRMLNQAGAGSSAGALADTSIDLEPRVINVYLPTLYARARSQLQSLRDATVVSADTSFEQLVSLFLSFTLTHELGHAFGLAHSDQPVDDHVVELLPPVGEGRQIQSAGQTFTVVYDERPSIMAANVVDYLIELRRYQRRPVVLSDIVPSRRDIEGVTRLYNVGYISPEFRRSWWQKLLNIHPRDET
ncbi:hypothetical protein [Tahibacter soli]|uniref:Matrixin n=1 Tax=Tahibacter soli TaxID=2983605 RepID=A0A9X4BIN3_9GAMM|nr:hypothetical protein [Tahibacter soli]MDC8015465.1 hypothetical protein [Tahibacter soli]